MEKYMKGRRENKNRAKKYIRKEKEDTDNDIEPRKTLTKHKRKETSQSDRSKISK